VSDNALPIVHAYFIAGVRVEVPENFDLAEWVNPFVPGEVFLSLEHYSNTTLTFRDGPLVTYVALLKLGTGVQEESGTIGFSPEMVYLLNTIKIGFDSDTLINQTLHEIVNKVKEAVLAPEAEEEPAPQARSLAAAEPVEPSPEELADAAAAAAVITLRSELAVTIDEIRDEAIGPRGIVVDFT